MYMYLIVYINVMYAFMYVCMYGLYDVCTYVCMYVSISIYIYLSMQFTLLHIHIKCWKDMNLPNRVSQSVSQKILITYQV